MAKKKSYHTIDELLEQQRQNAFSNFSVGDNKEYHTIDEIKKAATEQGLLTERAPVTQPSAQTTSGRRNLMIRNNQIKNDSRQWKQNQVDGSNQFDLRNQVYKTQNETIPRIAQQAASDYVKNRMGYNYLSQYGDDTRYSDVSNDISRVQQLKGGAARRGKDTEVYDRALDMLKGYSKKYRLDDTDTSPEAVKDREDLYNDNKREISRLNSQLEAEKRGSLNQALRQWLDSYDDNGIITDEDNQYIIDNIKNDTGYDLSETLGGLDSAERQAKAEELRALVGQDDSQERKRIQDRIEALTAQNTAYERTQKKSDDYADLYRDKAKEEEKDPYGLLSGSLHTRNMVPKDYYESVEGKDNPLFTESGDLSQPMIKRFEDSSDASSAYKNIDAHTEMLTADEKEIYSYLLRNKSELEAKAYIDELKDTLQKRYNDSVAEYIDDANGVEKAILLASSVPMNVYGSVTGFAEDAINMVTGGEIHPYSEAHAMYNIGQQTRSAVANDIDEATGGANVAGFSLGDAFQAAMSIPDFMLGSLTPEFYLTSMSMGAAQSRAKELWEEGASYDQIVSESVLTGAAEAIFEEVSLDKIIKMAKGGSLKDYITTALKGMAIEGSEEVNTEIANILTDVIVRGSQSDWEKTIQKYIDEGYSEEEAKGLALGDMVKQVGYAGVGGMIGGAGGSAGVAFNKAAGLIQQKQERNQYIRNVGEDVTGAGNAQALLDRAAQIDDPAVKAQAQRTRQALDKANQNSTKTTNNRLSRETGKLYAAMQDSTAQGIQNAEANEIKAAIKSAYAAETGETDSTVISKVADAIYKSEYTDERLTRSERNLAETAAAQSALESVKNNPDLIESATQKAQERGFRDYVETAKLTQKQEQETKTDDDVDIAEFNYHEDDGKVYTSDGKKQVDIASVASIGDNDITFALNDGQTESAKSLDMPTNQAVLAQSILDVQKKIGVPLTADIANTLYQGYEQSESPSISAYMQDAQTVLFNGYANNTAPDSSINLPQNLRNQLYRMGRQLAASHTQSQQQNVNARVKGNKSRKGTVTFQDGINRNKLDPRRRAGVDAVEHLSQSLGFDVVFYRSTKDGKGRFSSEYVRKNKFVADGQQAPSGFWRGGKMYLDINAGMNGEGLILFTASHELVHMIREGSPEDFKALSDFLVKNYAEQGVDINDLVRKEMARSTNLTRDQALEEVIAESCEPFLRDTTLNDKAQELYKQNPTLWSRIREALKRIVDAVKQWYSVASPQSEEARITMRADVETLEQAYDLWTKGIIKSAENLRNMEKSAEKGGASNSENINREYSDIDIKFSIREEDPPKKTVKGYKVFRIKDGKLYPPMVANPGGADTPVGVWLNADVGERAPDSKTGRAQVKGKGGMSLSFRPGWHLGDIPRASQFDRKNPETGVKDMFPSDFVWAECDCAADVDYQEEAMSYGYTDNGKFRHAYAGLPRVPENGYYKYRTNPRPDTVPWIITGAIKVNRILSDAEVAEILEKNGVKPPERQGGNKTLEELGLNNEHIMRQSRVDSDYLSAVERGDMETAQRMVDEAAKAAGYTPRVLYHGSNSKFNVFLHSESGKSNENASVGFWFTESKQGAENFANSVWYGQDDSPTVYSSYLKLNNPKVYEGSSEKKELESITESQKKLFTKMNTIGNKYYYEFNRRFSLTGVPDWDAFGFLVGKYDKDTQEYYLNKVSEKDRDKLLDDVQKYKKYLNEYNELDNRRHDLFYSDSYEKFRTDIYKLAGMTAQDANSGGVGGRALENKEEIISKFVSQLKEQGFDGIVIKDTRYDSGTMGGKNTQYVVFDSEQIKSADPVTYDDNGDVIPLSERFNESNKDIRYQARINVNNSPEFKKWFGDSHVVNDSNRPLVVYHQTNNDFTVFDTEHEGAGRNDDETPYGVFLKPNDNNIGLAGNKQMPLYASIQNPLYADRRVDLVQHYSKNIPEYSSKKAALNDIDREYMDRLEKAREEEDRQYRELWQKRRDGEITNSQFHDAIENMESDRILEEWSEASNKASRELKRIVTDYLRNSEYDGVIIKFDEGSFGRTTKTFIALDNTQVKSATDNVGTFDGSNPDIRYQSRDDDLFSVDDMFDDDSISSTVAREYITHHEDIGEVLRNIADIELPSSKVQSIVNRVIRNELGYLDEEARRTLSIELQLALERVSKTDAQDVSNEMINAVRKAVEGARITDERTQTSYQELRNVFKGKKFYLSDEQINQLKEHDMTFDDFRKAMSGKVTIVKRENAKRSINGGYANAQQLSLEGLHDLLDNPEEVLGIRRGEWDNKNYDAPYIIKNAFDTLREQQSQLVTDMYSDEAIDDMAIAIAAKITGDIVEAKYNSRKNPYVSKLVKDLQAKRAEAVNRQKERNKQKLAELKTKERERAEKREQDLKKKYQEQRDRNREGRKRTELRGKIRKLTDSLQRRLTAPKGKQYVPRALISQTVDVLNAVNLDSGRSTRLSEKLAALRNEYDKLKEREESYAMHDDFISNRLLDLSDSAGNTPIMKMTLSQLKQVYDVIRSMDYVIRESVKMTDTNFKKETHQIGRDWMAEIKAVPKEHVGILSGYVQTMLSAERFFNRIAGFKKNSTSSQLFDMLNKGQLAQTQYEMEFTQIFADLIQDKQLKSLYDTKNLVDIGLEDEDGNKVPITRGMMLSLYMHLLNEDNTRHVMGGGLTVPNMKDYYKGDVKKAFGSGMKSVRVGELDYSQYVEGIKSVIERQLTEYEIKWIEAAQEFFDVASRKALNETTMKLYGFRRASVNNYFPIHTDSNYRAATFENITKDMSLENSGFMKERVKASNPILLEDIVDVINDQISKVAKYCGMTLPIRNFQKVYGTTTFGFETSVQRELNRKFSASSKNTGATKYIDNLLTDLTSGRSTDEGFIARMMGRARGNLAQATLTLNPRVAIAQAASYPTAAAVIGWEPLFKALRKGGKNNTVFSRADREAIAEISPLLWKRTQGYSNVEIGDIKELRKQRHQVEGKLKKAMGWIEFFDGMTVGRLFYACQYYVDEQNPELKRGTAEYNAKVADVYNKVIERTQPNYTTLQRPDILRNPNALIKSLSMFMTQRLQNFNILYDAAGTYNRYLKDYKKGLNGVTTEDVKGARTTLVRSVTSQLVAAGTIVGMKLFADVLLHSMNAYRDDDDELTAESVSLKLLDNFADTLFGSVLFGSDLYALIKTAVSGERYYGISLSGVDSVVDAITNIVNLRKGITLDSANKAATSVCQLFGIPLNNAEKIGKAIYYWASDISGGEAFESGVNRTNKQNIHRYETRLNSGEADKANELLTAMLDDKMSQGKTEKEAKSWLRGRFTATYKQRYIDAMNNKDTEEVKNIREILLSTGLYGSLSDLDKALKKWLE